MIEQKEIVILVSPQHSLARKKLHNIKRKKVKVWQLCEKNMELIVKKLYEGVPLY